MSNDPADDTPLEATPLQRYYGARAPVYDAVYAKPERQADLRLIEQRLSTMLAGRRVLDVACGTGYFTERYAAAAAFVTGIDSSPEVLALARARQLGTARFELGDAYRLEQTEGRFDAALVSFFVSHVPLARRAQFVAGVKARLEPGALLIFLDNRFIAGNSTPIAAVDAEGNSFQDRPLDDGSVHRVLKNYPDRNAMLGLCAPAASTHWWQLDYYWWLDLHCLASKDR